MDPTFSSAQEERLKILHRQNQALEQQLAMSRSDRQEDQIGSIQRRRRLEALNQASIQGQAAAIVAGYASNRGATDVWQSGFPAGMAPDSGTAQALSLRGLFTQGYTAPLYRQLTGGVLFQTAGYATAFSAARVQAEARAELSRRLPYAGSSLAALIPYELRARFGGGFAGGELMRYSERGFQSAFDALRGTDATGLGSGRPDGRGFLVSDSPVLSASKAFRATMERLNVRNRLGMTEDDFTNIGDVVTTEIGRNLLQDSRRALRAGGPKEAAASLASAQATQIEALAAGMQNLARSLNLNTEQTQKLVYEGQKAGMTGTGVMAAGRVAQNLFGNRSAGFSPSQALQYLMPVVEQSRAAGFNESTLNAAMVRTSNFAEGWSSQRLSRNFVMRLGGENESEGFLRSAMRQTELGNAFADRNIGALGAALSAGVRLSRDPMSVAASAGAVFAANPFAPLQATQSRSARSNLSNVSDLAAYSAASQHAARMGLSASETTAIGAAIFGNMMGMDAVEGREMYNFLAAGAPSPDSSQFDGYMNTQMVARDMGIGLTGDIEDFVAAHGTGSRGDIAQALANKFGQLTKKDIKADLEGSGLMLSEMSARLGLRISEPNPSGFRARLEQSMETVRSFNPFHTPKSHAERTMLGANISDPSDLYDSMRSGTYKGGKISADLTMTGLQGIFGSDPSSVVVDALTGISLSDEPGVSAAARKEQIVNAFETGNDSILGSFNEQERQKLVRFAINFSLSQANSNKNREAETIRPNGTKTAPFYVILE